MASGRFEIYHARAGQLTWRLLSSNNRDLGHAPVAFATEPECLESIAVLRRQAVAATRAVHRAEQGMWSWRLGATRELAVSSRLYQRHLQAVGACALFVELVVDAELSTRY